MISVDHLSKNYGSTVAVEDVSFEVSPREVLGFLGPNGAGKTTTMRILTGFIPPTGGTARVAGFDVVDQPLEAKARIGYLPESAPLYEDMGVVDYLHYVAEMRGIVGPTRRHSVRRVVDLCGLDGALAKKIGQLSKGYRQRVGLAQALIHEPDILILDEPTSGLDPNQIIEIRSLIREIGREKTVILSTHILPEVSATCDRVIIIARGRLVGTGTPDELMRQGGGAGVTVVLRGDGTDVDRALGGLEHAEGVEFLGPEAEALRYHLKARTGARLSDLAESVAMLAAAKGWPLRELRPVAASLEDVFRDLTTKE
jgi:ABC-2 type transport system ATP-binding protein